MKNVLAVLFLIVLGQASQLENKLKELDRLLEERDKYSSAYIVRIDSLKSGLSSMSNDSIRWEQEFKLFDLYKNFQIDSASRFLEKLEQHSTDIHQRLKTTIARARVLIAGSDYSAADMILSGIDLSNITEAEKAEYYNMLLLLYSYQINEGNLSETAREEYVRKRYETRKLYISCEGIDDFERIRRPAIQMYEDGEVSKAIPILEDLLKISPEDRKAHACYSLAKAYEMKGDFREAKYWFAQGAIYNLKYLSGEFQSLYDLSLILFDEHQFQRALAYSQAALEESLNCNYSSRINNSAKSQLSIVKAAEYQERKSMKLMSTAILFLLVLCGFIFYFWRRTTRQAREISESAVKIRQMNGKLEEAGKIKEGYVQRYIALSSSYLNLFKKYRHDLIVTLREQGAKEMTKKLRQPDYEILEMDYKQFYAIFDETFLGIYPDFIKTVNSLLGEDARFQDIGSGGELPMKLRVLALVCLGIKDSGRIAQILNVAPSSVYTYRSKIKKCAVCNPENFEMNLENALTVFQSGEVR